MLKNSRHIFVLFVLIAVAIFAVFVAVGYTAGHGNLIMPLDDVYIHFQYAKQMALGQPYVYNPGQAPTSGATSFLYPYLLAFGYLIGFKGLWLGLWAMFIGLIALIAAQWAVYGLCQSFGCPQWLSILTTVLFTLTGSIAWHFMSGMETGLMITLTLWTLLMVVEKRLRGFVVAATLLALMRPEGGILVFIAVGTMFLRLWRDYGAYEKRSGKRHLLLLLLIPVLAIEVQPLVNWLVTGSAIATGNQAKSILATVPHDWGVIIGRIWDNFVRMWWEFVTGYDVREGRGWYLPLFTGILAIFAIVMLMFQRGKWLIGWMLLGWLLATTAAISTLDTAFWHFKRYQIPIMALFFPLSAYVLSVILTRKWARHALRYGLYAYIALVLPLFAIALLVQFVNYYRLNVGYVYQQPYQMALWLHENTPEDAVIAVHDVGMMRYMGERTTLDIVGLTTPGAAAYWRNGPGSVAEFLINEQPDYIANYGRGHGYGLAYLADTALYGEPLASFPIENWNRQANVALAADFQGIYQVNRNHVWMGQEPHYNLTFPFNRGSFEQVPYYEVLNVANLESEANYEYLWYSSGGYTGFPTDVYEMEFVSCDYQFYACNHPNRRYLDGGRRINEMESFTLNGLDETAGILIASIVHPVDAGTIEVYANDEYVDTFVIPSEPGVWRSILTYIPQNFVTSSTHIEFKVNMREGYYAPYTHVFLQGNFTIPAVSDPLATVQNGAMMLTDYYTYVHLDNRLDLGIFWVSDGTSNGDYRFFAHLYDDVNQPPIAQQDEYFAGMPVGNWLPGTLNDTITLNIADVPPGTYTVAIGFYNPQTGERLVPTSDKYEVSADGRLWLGEVTIGENAIDTQD